MKERIQAEQIPEGFKTTKDIFQETGKLEAGQSLPTQYWLATREGASKLVEDTENGTASRRVYRFEMNMDNVFNAHELRDMNGELIPTDKPYTYIELGPRVKGLGAAGFVPYIESEKVAPPTEAKQVKPETIKQQREREIRDSAIAYIQMINEKLHDSAFMRISEERLIKIRLYDRIRDLAPKQLDTKAEGGVLLQESRTLPPGVKPDMENMRNVELLPTLTIRLMHKTQPLTGDATTTELHVPQIEILTALIHEIDNFNKGYSRLKEALISKGIRLLRIEVGSWRERAGEKYELDVLIRIADLANPDKKIKSEMIRARLKPSSFE